MTSVTSPAYDVSVTNLDTGVADSTPAPDQGAPAEAPEVAPDQPAAEASSEPDAEPAAEEPSREYLDPDEVGDRYVRVKVDGEEVEVPLSEALNGYSRTEDYTRKRQADADDLRLAQNLRENPAATLQMIAARQGMTVPELLNGGRPVAPPQPVEQPPEDPMERQLWELNREVRTLREEQVQREADTALQRAVDGLKQAYGATDEEVHQTVQAAFQMGQQTGQPVSPAMLPLFYGSLKHFQAVAQSEATQQHAATQQAEASQRQADAQAAAAAVGAGGSANGTAEVTPDRLMTPVEAVEAALAQYDVR